MDSLYDSRLQQFEQKLGISFKDKSLLITSLTHRSYANQYRRDGELVDNERLEFFGDAILKFLISEWLFERFQAYSEGQLTKLRSKLISDKNLAVLGTLIDVGLVLRVSTGEYSVKGDYKGSMLADTVEAVLGALYLDSGLDVVRELVQRLYHLYYDQLTVDERLFDYKSDLQELLQKKREILPVYTVTSTDGPEHEKRFYVDVTFTLDGHNFVFSGCDMTKKDAEQVAAKEALVFLESQPH